MFLEISPSSKVEASIVDLQEGLLPVTSELAIPHAGFVRHASPTKRT